MRFLLLLALLLAATGVRAATCAQLDENRCHLTPCFWDTETKKCKDPQTLEPTMAPATTEPPVVSLRPSIAPVQCLRFRRDECRANNKDCLYIGFYGCIPRPNKKTTCNWLWTPHRWTSGKECRTNKRLHLDRAFKRCRYSPFYDDEEDDDHFEFRYIPKNLSLKQLWCELAPQYIRNSSMTCVGKCVERDTLSGLDDVQAWCRQMDNGNSLEKKMAEYGCPSTCDQIIAQGLMLNSEVRTLGIPMEDSSARALFNSGLGMLVLLMAVVL